MFKKKNGLDSATTVVELMEKWKDEMLKEKWYIKLWRDIEYYLWRVPCDFFLDVENYFINLHRFRRELWKFRSWDYYYPVMMFKRSLELLRDSIMYGPEELVSRDKKVAAINELLSLLVEHDRDEFETNDEYEVALTKQVNRIARIIRGQTCDDIQRKMDKRKAAILKSKNKKKIKEYEREGWYRLWAESFDGTGFYGWWE